MKKPDNGIIGIYKITNPKGKVYIGKSKNILNRWYKYNGLKCEKQKLIFNSLKKYGPKNHEFEIIEECLEEQLLDRELYYKEMFLKENNKKMALFCNLKDGESGPHIQTNDSNMKRSKSLKEYWECNKHPSAGISRSLEFREKHYKPILQYDLNGDFIKEWSSQIEVYEVLGIDINNCLKKRYKTSGGYQWIYKNVEILHNIGAFGHYDKKISKAYSYKKPPRTQEHCNNISKGKIGKGLKPILQYDLEGNLIKEWESQSKASEETNIPLSCINLCLKGKNKTSYNFKWIYKM